MVYCINCGKQNITDFDFCFNCGAKLVKSAEMAANPDPADSSGPTGQNPAPGQQSGPENPQPAFPGSSLPGQPGPYGQNFPPPGYPNGATPSGQNFRPPYPYGTPPAGKRNQPQRYPVAANGKPFVVIDHPEAFYAYKNADGKQVYASFATIQARILAALFDTCLLYLPLQYIAWTLMVIFNPETQKMLQAITRSPDQMQLQEINMLMPGWATLLIWTITLVYSVLMTWKGGGQTLGKKILRIKVIGLDGRPPNFQSALNRNLFGYAYGLGTVGFVIGGFGTVVGFCLQLMVFMGFTAAFFNRERRGWHDRLADTYVVGKNELVQGVNY
ncbi:MAG: hypothetical protein JWP00_817 [Chloroflexi bacterium]|nr:hypothetical protein [Chloroflexota bacterium]